jgi:molecular chaperone IbpA
MTTFDVFSFPAFDKHFVGFDSILKRIQDAQQNLAKTIPNYPPYNILKVDDNRYVIELAVAGFGKQNLDITIEDGTLTIAGQTNVDSEEDNQASYLYKGIADRSFTRKFSLADSVEIKNAELINGMLKVWLENIIPESKKPKKVDITDTPEEAKVSEKTLLTEGKK